MINIDHFIVAMDTTRVNNADKWCWRLFVCTGNHLYGERAHYDTYETAWDKAQLIIDNKRPLSFDQMELWVNSSDPTYLHTLCFFSKQGEVALGISYGDGPDFTFTPTQTAAKVGKVENSGRHCEYYHCEVTHPQNPNQNVPYIANCEDIIQALGLTFDEGCEFKSIWRRGRGRQGFKKAETTAVRDATKAVHYAQRVLAFEQRMASISDAHDEEIKNLVFRVGEL